MNKELTHRFFEPRKQSPVAIFTILITFIKRIIRMFWFVFLPLLVGKNSNNSFFEISVSTVALAISGFSLVMAILSYFKYFYFVDDTSFNIHKGIFNKKKINLPFERIQNINFEQKIIHQIFNVVSLQIDTAGSSGNEIKIDALLKSEAEAIRDYILEQKRSLSTVADTKLEGEKEQEGTTIKDELILRLFPKDLLKIGVSENHFQTALIVMGITWGLVGNLEDLFDFDFYNYISDQSSLLLPFIFFLFLSFFLTLIRTLLNFFDLKFFKSHEGYKVNAGLLNKQEVSLRKEKIQIIQWSENPIRRLFKIFTLDIKQAVAGLAGNKKKKAVVPGCYIEQVNLVIDSCFPDFKNDDFKEHNIDRSFVYRRFLYVGLIPMSLLLVNFFFSKEIGMLITAFLLPFIIFLLLSKYQKKYRVSIGEQYFKITKGFIGTSNTISPYYKIQAVELVQSIFQRRKGLASIEIHTANGVLRIPYFELEKAQILRNYILYKIETSQQAWM